MFKGDIGRIDLHNPFFPNELTLFVFSIVSNAKERASSVSACRVFAAPVFLTHETMAK